jgi:type VI secretion system VgrG family protein
MAGITRKTINLIESILGIRSKAHQLYEERHVLVVNGLPEDTFNVISFSSDGGLNRCYRAEALLTSHTPDIDLDQLLRAPVFAFSEGKRGSFITVRGHVAECEQQGAYRDSYYYRVVLVPKLWFLTRTSHNQIFLNKTVVQILEELLLDGGLLRDEFEFRLTGSYDKVWEYVCQYNESHFDFFSRWLEREGLYFYLESNDDLDKLIITDSVQLHQPPQADHPLHFRPDSGLEFSKGTSILNRFSAGCCQVPGKVTLKDYNYRHPSLDLTGSATIDTEGHGEVYLYGNHLQTPEESKRLAKVRAEAIACRKRVFSGSSNSFSLRPGALFTVQDHFRQEYNSTYLVIDILHEGHQPCLDCSSPDTVTAGEEKKPHYWNRFSAIPASAQYRALPSTTRPRFHGMLNAVIDAAGPGQQPELDEQGRYKVQLPFDLSGKPGGKASAWLRMAQPYAGSEHGMHFPLKKGTEVLLTFIDGDPDRPIIAAAVPNPLNPSQITSKNATLAGFTTPGNGQIVSQNLPGRESITMSQGGDASVTVTGNTMGSEVGTNSNLTWSLAKYGSMGLSMLFSYNYSFGTSAQVVGFKKNLLGICGALQTGANKLSSLSSEFGNKFPVMQTAIPIAAGVVDTITGIYIGRNLQKRLLANIPDAPQLGYGIFADNRGCLTYMHAPPIAPAPDIALISDTGSIDLIADKHINLLPATLYAHTTAKLKLQRGLEEGTHSILETSTENSRRMTLATQFGNGLQYRAALDLVETGLRLSSLNNGEFRIGHYPEAVPRDVPSIALSNNTIETVCSVDTTIITGNPSQPTEHTKLKITPSKLTGIAPAGGRATLAVADKSGISMVADSVEITVGKEHKIIISSQGIKISTPESVKIKGLTVEDDTLSYKGSKATIANVLKIK